MASGRNERALSRPSIPLDAHSTVKPQSANSAVISSAVSLSSSIRSSFAIFFRPSTTANLFAVLGSTTAEAVRLPETDAIVSTPCDAAGFA
jgi:hypothetical protein